MRHHRIPVNLKQWLVKTANALGHTQVSTRAGLHAYFFFSAREIGKDGDVGCFLTASEWLDVDYGRAVRTLLLDGLGATAIDVLHPETQAFKAVESTALVTCFKFGSKRRTIRFRQVKEIEELATLATGNQLKVAAFSASHRWTSLLTVKDDPVPRGYARIPLRRLVSLRRGIATGANAFFVMATADAEYLGLSNWCVPVISRATEILDSHGVVRNRGDHKRLLLVPGDIARKKFPELNRYLCRGEHDRTSQVRIKDRVLCQQRKPWYSVEWPNPSPIVATYMARKPPMFALNPDKLGLLNIGHYLQPRRSDLDVEAVVCELNKQRVRLVGGGRTYQGGLEKFEPSEMLNLEVDIPNRLLKAEEHLPV